MPGHETEEANQRAIDLGHLSAGVGHHVINAFSAVVSNAELLRLDPPVPGLADPVVIANNIIQAALEASTVARRLIDYSRPVTSTEPNRAAFPPQTIGLEAIIREVVEAERAGGAPTVVWKTDLNGLTPINGHPPQLRSMLSYLFENAKDALPASGGTVLVSTSLDSRAWNVIEIHDTGQGMTQATLERAVEPFFSTKPGRLGVGLSIANGIWRRHRGTLSIQSQPGEGTRIRLCVEPGPA